jgi:hypothetical protein
MSNSVRAELDVGTTSVPLAGCSGLLAGILLRRFGQRPQFRDTFLRLLTPPPTMTEPQRVMGMIGAVRPARIDKRVVKPLLKVVDHSLLVVVRGIGENTDPTSHLRDFIPVVTTDCRGNVHLQQANHALLVFIRYRAFKGGFNVVLTEAATADWTGPSKRQMSSTQQPSAHQTNAAL